MIMASLWVGLTLPGMIDEPGSFSGRASSPSPLRGPEPSQRRSSAIFISETASVRRAPWVKTRASWAARAANLLGAVTKGSPVMAAIAAATRCAELGVRVEAGAHRRAAGRQLVEAGQGQLDALEVGVQLGHVAGELLAQGERDGVHQVGAPDFGDVGVGDFLLVQRVAQRRHRRQQPVHDLLGRRDVHGGREGVVRRLRHVHVVVGVDRLLRSHLAAGQLDGPVGDDLVGVHVGLGAAAGLPDVEGELVVPRPLGHLGRGLLDQVGQRRLELAQVAVDLGRGPLQDPEGPDDRAWASSRRRCRSGAASAPSALPSTGPRGPRSPPCCRFPPECFPREPAYDRRASRPSWTGLPGRRDVRGPGAVAVAGDLEDGREVHQRRVAEQQRPGAAAPMVPSPTLAWRSRLAPSSTLESLRCRQRSRSSPMTASKSATTSSASSTEA